eukprot:EG_transcript_29688
MFFGCRLLFRPAGAVRRVGQRYGFITYQEGSEKREVLLPAVIPELTNLSIKFDVLDVKGKYLRAIDVKLCDGATATGQIMFFNAFKRFGLAKAKDGTVVSLHPKQMQDASFAAYLIKPRVGQEVQFDVEEAAHGPRAINVRRILTKTPPASTPST